MSDDKQVSQQPNSQPEMAVSPGGAGGNRNAKDMPIGPEGREWTFKLLDCSGQGRACEFSMSSLLVDVLFAYI